MLGLVAESGRVGARVGGVTCEMRGSACARLTSSSCASALSYAPVCFGRCSSGSQIAVPDMVRGDAVRNSSKFEEGNYRTPAPVVTYGPKDITQTRSQLASY